MDVDDVIDRLGETDTSAPPDTPSGSHRLGVPMSSTRSYPIRKDLFEKRTEGTTDRDDLLKAAKALTEDLNGDGRSTDTYRPSLKTEYLVASSSWGPLGNGATSSTRMGRWF